MEARSFRAPGGTHDIFWPESWRWEVLTSDFARLVQDCGFGLLQSPMFEFADVFHRGIGEQSDVVGKEMYEFADRDGQMLALRPEGTASVVRAFIQHHPPLPFKAWYVTPAFRHERPQAGRFRQHHQLGIEAIGSMDPDLDAEIIWLASEFFSKVGLSNIVLSLNSMGDGQCRPGYLEALRSYFRKFQGTLCEEHEGRIDANPLRILDCKKKTCHVVCEEAPHLADQLCVPCGSHFERVQAGLDALSVPFTLRHTLVRGFDYYSKTTFEFASGAMTASQNGIGGGGRYDGLVEMLGGEVAPGIGFGIGIERVLLAADAEGVYVQNAPSPQVFVVDVTDGGVARTLIVEMLRANIPAERAYDARSMKAQMKQADRSGASLALIIGESEKRDDTVTIRPLRRNKEEGVVLGVQGDKAPKPLDVQRIVSRGDLLLVLKEML